MKEVQIFFLIIIIGIVVYVALSILGPLLKGVKSAIKGEEPSEMPSIKNMQKESSKLAKVKERLGKKIEYEHVEVEDEKPLLTFSLDMVLMERSVYITIIILELIWIIIKLVT